MKWIKYINKQKETGVLQIEQRAYYQVNNQREKYLSKLTVIIQNSCRIKQIKNRKSY